MEEEPYKRKLTKAEKKAKYRTDYAEPLKSRREVLKAIMNGPESERERKVRAKNREFFNEDYRSGKHFKVLLLLKTLKNPHS